MGDAINTLTNINVGLKWCSNPFYPDGSPDFWQKDPYGDGTVLQSSAILGNGVSYGSPVQEKHSKLVSAFANEVATFIDAGSPLAQSEIKIPALEAQGLLNNPSVLSLSMNGKVRPLLISPNSLRSGIDNNLSVNEIPNASVSVGVEAGSINIENPADGTYSIAITGIQEEDYSLVISYVDSTGENELFSAHSFNHANTITFTFTIDSLATDKLIINHTPLSPTGLQADAVDNGGLKTQLTWDASTAPDVTGYNIYSKEYDEPYFSLIDSTANALYDTTHPWAENSSIKRRIYAVSAVKADSTESFLSNMAENNDRDHDGLSDEEETSFGTDVNNPDTDGDGLTDGEEYIRGTNPLLTDTDGDNFNDYVEIQAGSDPLDSNSIPEPIPGIMANGLDGTVTIAQSDSLSISISMDPTAYSGSNADWWILLFYYDSGSDSWVPVPLASFQLPLFDLPLTEIVNTTGMSPGWFIFLFGVDLNPNGLIDADWYYDFVIVEVTP